MWVEQENSCAKTDISSIAGSWSTLVQTPCSVFATQIDIIIPTHDKVSKPFPIASQINVCASDPSTMGVSRLGQILLNWHVLQYDPIVEYSYTDRLINVHNVCITKFIAAYASVTIRRWVTGRRSMCTASQTTMFGSGWGTSRSSPRPWFGFGRRGEWVDTMVHKITPEQRMEKLSSSGDRVWSLLLMHAQRDPWP